MCAHGSCLRRKARLQCAGRRREDEIDNLMIGQARRVRSIRGGGGGSVSRMDASRPQKSWSASKIKIGVVGPVRPRPLPAPWQQHASAITKNRRCTFTSRGERAVKGGGTAAELRRATPRVPHEEVKGRTSATKPARSGEGRVGVHAAFSRQHSRTRASRCSQRPTAGNG